MVSRTFKVGQAFGKRGVLSKATQAVPEEVGGGGVTAYANLAAFPSSGNTVGDYAFATDTKAVYIWDGAEWDRVSTGNNETPRLTTTPASAHSLNSGGSTTAITIAASDPEGFPITYSHDTNPTSPNQITNVAESNGVFTLTPSTNSAHAGNFTLRLKASDGISTISHPITVSLAFNTDFTFDTSLSTISSTYTTTNKIGADVGASSTATSQQIGRMGKGYIEMKIITAVAYMMIGMGSGSFNATYSSGDSVYLYSDGKKYTGNSATGLSGYGVNDILMFAYDTAAGQVWLGRNGSWGNKNPASDAGWTCTGSPSVNGFKPMFNGGSSTQAGLQVEFISHTQGAQYTIPTGWVLA